MTEERIYDGGMSLALSNEELTDALGDAIVHLDRLSSQIEVMAVRVETPPPIGECISKATFEIATDFYAKWLKENQDRITALEGQLEVEAPQPPAPGWFVALTERLDSLTETDKELRNRLADLELRQNLVESPVMIRIATALELLAGCVEHGSEVGDEGLRVAVHWLRTWGDS
jgi:hypothetical protein